MSNRLIEEQTLLDIGNTIREKTGLNATYKPNMMASALRSISAGTLINKYVGIINGESSGSMMINVLSIRDYAMAYVSGLTAITASNASAIGASAFYGCTSLTNISFPACTRIHERAFESCVSLMSASFPACTYIGTSAFYGCTSLTNASFPACTQIGASAFRGCSNLTNASFPACTQIGSHAFVGCSNLTNASFPACTQIGSYAFYGCALSSINCDEQYPALTTLTDCAFLISAPYALRTFIANAVTSMTGTYHLCDNRGLSYAELTSTLNIGYACFLRCYNLSNVNAPACTRIHERAFESCVSLMSASFPACTQIETHAFYGCTSLTNASFPACTQIRSYAFRGCSNLTNASFPACTQIGSYAFYDCQSLMALYLLGPSVCELAHKNAFTNTPISNASGSIYVPSELVDLYKSAKNWSLYADQITAYTGE